MSLALAGGLVVGSGLAVLLAAEAARWRWIAAAAKAVASTGLLLTAVGLGLPGTAVGRLVLAGLALSWAGDLLLVFPGKAAFLAGLASFLAAHLAYVAAFVRRGLSPLVAAVAFALLLVPRHLVLRWLRPHVSGGMARPVAAYALAITAMVAGALGTFAAHPDPVLVAGAVLFYLSDLTVARDRFVAPGPVNRLVGLPLYYAGQVLLAVAVARG